jgi:amino acid permease
MIFNKTFLKATLMQYSGIVGAGIFVLPYVFYYSNFKFAVFWLIFLTFSTMFVHEIYINIILATKGDHQLPGYAEIHLGKFFKNLATINIIVLCFGALSAFIKLGSGYLNLFFPEINFYIIQLFFLLGISLFHFSQIKIIKQISYYLPIISLLIVFYLFIVTIQTPFIIQSNHLPNFTFFGSLIFSLAGFIIIPEMEELLRKEKNLKFQLIWSSRLGLFLASLTYLLFIISIIVLSNDHLSTDAISGIFISSPLLGKILAVLGTLLTFKASLNLTLALKEMFFRDIKLSRKNSFLWAWLIPFSTLLLTGFSFMSIISFTGAITISISVFIILCVKLKCG